MLGSHPTVRARKLRAEANQRWVEAEQWEAFARTKARGEVLERWLSAERSRGAMETKLLRAPPAVSKEPVATPAGEGIAVEGYASTFGPPPDEGNDIVERGAFAESLARRVPAGLVPLLDTHALSGQTTIGSVVEAEEDSFGLRFRALLSGSPDVRGLATKIREGHLRGVSIGYTVLPGGERFERLGRTTVRYITKAELYEVSIVPIAMNPRAHVTGVEPAE